MSYGIVTMSVRSLFSLEGRGAVKCWMERVALVCQILVVLWENEGINEKNNILFTKSNKDEVNKTIL